MKIQLFLHCFVAAISACSTLHAAETFTLVVNAPSNSAGESAAIVLNAGDTAELKFASPSLNPQNNSTTLRVSATIGNSSFDLPSLVPISATVSENYSAWAANPIKIVGPGSIKLKLSGGSTSARSEFATFEVNRAGTASNATAIPLEAGTTWQVILEASTDLVNWTPVAPGDYASASPQRFFRTRLVKRQ